MDKKTDWKWVVLIILGLVVLPAVIVLVVLYHKSIMTFLNDFKTEMKNRMLSVSDQRKTDEEQSITIDLGGIQRDA